MVKFLNYIMDFFNKLNINGKTVSTNVKSVSFSNSKIVVNGQDIGFDMNQKNFYVTIDGNVENVSIDNGRVEVNGNVGKDVITTNGDIVISEGVDGNVKTTNGDVICTSIGGSVTTTNGDITTRK